MLRVVLVVAWDTPRGWDNATRTLAKKSYAILAAPSEAMGGPGGPGQPWAMASDPLPEPFYLVKDFGFGVGRPLRFLGSLLCRLIGTWPTIVSDFSVRMGETVAYPVC